MRLAHLVNPVRAPAGSELAEAQRLSLPSMVAAAADAGGVELWSAHFAEDEPLAPPFRATPDLDRSVLDLGRFAIPRKLPLLADLLHRLYAATRAEVLIYTNVDIALQQGFYRDVRALATSGIDAASITRRTVPAGPAAEPLASVAARALSEGTPHRGHDCFFFRRELLEGIDFGGLCIGFPPFGRVLVALLSSRSAQFRVRTDLDWTYHVGDERSWRDERYLDYWRHNRSEALAVLDRAGSLSAQAQAIRESISAQERL